MSRNRSERYIGGELEPPIFIEHRILSTVFFKNQSDVRKSKTMQLWFWFCSWNGTIYNYNRFRCVSDRDKKVLLCNGHDMNRFIALIILLTRFNGIIQKV